jgi:hypothetical protein
MKGESTYLNRNEFITTRKTARFHKFNFFHGPVCKFECDKQLGQVVVEYWRSAKLEIVPDLQSDQ